MKRILFIIMIFTVYLWSGSAFAAGYLTGQEFVFDAYSLLKCDDAEDYSSALEVFYEFNIINEDEFSPGAYITKENAAVILAKVFLVRCGETLATGRSTYLYDYLSIKDENRVYIDTAEVIGAVSYNSSLKFLPKSHISEDVGDTIIGNTRKAIENLTNKAGLGTVVNITDENGYTNRINNEKNILVTVSINDVPEYVSDSVMLICAITENDKINEVYMKKEENIEDGKFYTISQKIDCGGISPKSQLNVYLWDGAKMIPLKNKYILSSTNTK